MNKAGQIELERPAVADDGLKAGPKSILLHVQNDDSLEDRLQTALAIARASSAHISCLHLTPIEAYVAFDNFGGVFVMQDVIKAIDDEERSLRASLEAKLSKEDVSWDYRQMTGSTPYQLIRQAALADLIVTGRQPHRTDFAGPAIGIMGEILNHSRTPLLIPAGDGTVLDPGGTALIAWNASYEAANAVRSSIEMLKLASRVHVIRAQEEREDAFPDTTLLEYLSRHGIHADYRAETGAEARTPDFIIAAILANARDVDASYLVMGGYSHSRIGEYLLGGVTRSLLRECPLPLLVAH